MREKNEIRWQSNTCLRNEIIKELKKENKLLKNMNREYKKEIERLNRKLNNANKTTRTLTEEELNEIYINNNENDFNEIKNKENEYV